ncbi:hypothetical protein D9599_12240 [Roseomonas sp. KE2513]|uniref:hypothetical protein n=1 Tax=Roseomonas sp. KE2513 TaxID=2479202 RepID=UPI0018DFB0FA|nr:hypothetical protein [Roseomonas sp. KE2513]MBI0536344.1 hypothetical protein [Roseomonas sp. KE2513]
MMRSALLRRGLLALGLLVGGLAAPPVRAQNSDPSFNVVNRSGRTIQELYVSSAQVNSWGQDLLGQNVLDNGRSFPVRLPSGQCVNDIRVVYDGGQSEERRAIDTCPLNEVVFGQGSGAPGGSGKGGAQAAGRTGNPSFNLVNRTRKTIQVLRASPSSQSSWGDDRLGDAVVAPGGTFAIRLPAGECNYDIRVEYDDRSAEERRAVDLCNVSSVTFP